MNTELVRELELACVGLPKAEQKAAVAAFAERVGLKPDTVRKALSRRQGIAKAVHPPRVTPELEAAVRTVWAAKWTPDGPISTEAALQLCLSEARLPRPWPVSSLNAAARTLGLNDGAGYVRRMEAAYAGQAHRVDASGSRHFRVIEPAGEGDWTLRVVREEQRNKRWADGSLLWLVVVIDDYSRVLNAEYHVAPGESAALVQGTLLRTWRGEAGALPRGVPHEFLLCDQGSFGKDLSTKALLSWLGVELVTGMPHNSQRNGRVERPIRDLKEGFERAYLATHKEGALCRLSQIKDELRQYLRLANERRHPLRRTLSKRADWAQSIGFRGIRECPEDALRMATYRAERTVAKDGRVQHDNRIYEVVGLPFGMAGRRITVVFNRDGELVAEHDGRHFALRDAAAVSLGSYGSEAQRGRSTAPAAQVAREAQERAPTEVGLFSPRRAGALAAAGFEQRAPGQPVRPTLVASNGQIVTPQPRLRPATEQPAAFDAPLPPARFAGLEEARRAMGDVIGQPLHTLLDEARLAQVDAALQARGYDRAFTNELAAELKHAAGV